jgi:pterin-4a-carbinolamine dehydratase
MFGEIVYHHLVVMRSWRRHHHTHIAMSCFAGRQGLSPIATSIHCFSSSSSSSSSSLYRPDPFARRPTSKCDPYGQGGLPLTWSEAKKLLPTVDSQWKLWRSNKDGTDGTADDTLTTTTILDEKEDSNNTNPPNNCEDTTIPFAIVKDFWHAEYMHGAKFVSNVVSAVAQINNHFPYQVLLERTLSSSRRERVWKVRTRVICRTVVLQGLSHHDFFLAAMLDVETNRPEVQNLIMISPTKSTIQGGGSS